MNVLKYGVSDDTHIPVTRYQMRPTVTGSKLVEVGNAKPFLKGPIHLDWLSAAAHLPGKAMNVALAVRWLVDMNGGKPVKLTRKALTLLNVSEDACSDGLRRLEGAGLITVVRQPGQRPVVGLRQLAQHR